MKNSLALSLLFAFAALSCAFRIPLLEDLDLENYNNHHTRSVESVCSAPGNLTCVSQGDTCYVAGSTNPVYVCYDGYCDYTTTKCPSVPTLGEACTTTCTSAYECHPVTQVCVSPQYIVGAGAECSEDAQCVMMFNKTLEITNCTSGVCFGLPLGASCEANSGQCSGRAFCSNGVCTALLATGATCDSTNEDAGGCSTADVCSNGVCTEIYSGAAGDSCNFASECGANLYCSGTFAKAGTCSTPGPSGVACDFGQTASACDAGAYCSCAAGAVNTTCIYPMINYAIQVSVVRAFLECADDNLCVGMQCAFENCAPQYCAYRSLILGYFNSTSGNCYAEHQLEIYELLFPAPASCAAATTTTVATASSTGSTATASSTGTTAAATATASASTFGSTVGHSTSSASQSVNNIFAVVFLIFASVLMM